jgi:hypothetical protein
MVPCCRTLAVTSCRSGGPHDQECRPHPPGTGTLWAAWLATPGPVPAQAPAGAPVPVTIDSFVRAESDLYFAGILKDSGGRLATFNHRREVASVENQTVIRLNRDTLYSSALFDLDAGR